jgi:hypothetical protein
VRKTKHRGYLHRQPEQYRDASASNFPQATSGLTIVADYASDLYQTTMRQAAHR